jgi:hypothetical protein
MVDLQTAKSIIQTMDGLSTRLERNRVYIMKGKFPMEDGSWRIDVTAMLPGTVREEIVRMRRVY